MYDLPVEARIDITPTRKHQPIQATDRRPEHGKDIVKAILIGEDGEGIIATEDDGQRWNENWRATSLKDGVDRGSISGVDRPSSITQAPTGRKQANPGTMAVRLRPSSRQRGDAPGLTAWKMAWMESIGLIMHVFDPSVQRRSFGAGRLASPPSACNRR